MSIPQQADPIPTVHVIDDDEALRAGLCNLLRSAGIEASAFSSPQNFLETASSETRGCLLLDIRFPGASGLEFQSEMASHGIRMPIILMTGHADVPSTKQGLLAGAVDFLVKPFEDEELFTAVGVALERDLTLHRSEIELGDVSVRYATLTSREREVMALVCTGLMNKQVAGKLDLSEITVKVHRGTMMRKMGVRNVPDLVRLAAALQSA